MFSIFIEILSVFYVFSKKLAVRVISYSQISGQIRQPEWFFVNSSRTMGDTEKMVKNIIVDNFIPYILLMRKFSVSVVLFEIFSIKSKKYSIYVRDLSVGLGNFCLFFELNFK